MKEYRVEIVALVVAGVFAFCCVAARPITATANAAKKMLDPKLFNLSETRKDLAKLGDPIREQAQRDLMAQGLNFEVIGTVNHLIDGSRAMYGSPKGSDIGQIIHIPMEGKYEIVRSGLPRDPRMDLHVNEKTWTFFDPKVKNGTYTISYDGGKLWGSPEDFSDSDVKASLLGCAK